MRSSIAPLLLITSIGLVGCAPETGSSSDVPTPTSQLDTAKEFASDIYTMTEGVQNLFITNGVLEQVSTDAQNAETFYNESAGNVGATLVIASAGIAHVLVAAFTDWDGTLDGAGPTGYNFDYSAIPANTSISNIPMVNDILEYMVDFSVTNGAVNWNSAAKTMSVSLNLFNTFNGETTTLTSSVTLPSNTNGTLFNYSLNNLNISNNKANISFETQPAVYVTLELHDTVNFATGELQVPTESDNLYLKFKKLSVDSSKMNIDFIGAAGIRDLHFDGIASIEIVRTTKTNEYGGLLAIPTKLQFDGIFAFGDFTSSATLGFTATNVNGLYLVEDAIKSEIINASGAPNYYDINSWINSDFNLENNTFTLTPNDLNGLGSYWDSAYDEFGNYIGNIAYPVVRQTIQEISTANPDIKQVTSIEYYLDAYGAEQSGSTYNWQKVNSPVAALEIQTSNTSYTGLAGLVNPYLFEEWTCDESGCTSIYHINDYGFINISEILAGNSSGNIYPCTLVDGICNAAESIPFSVVGDVLFISATSGDTLEIKRNDNNSSWVITNQSNGNEFRYLAEINSCYSCWFWGDSQTEIFHSASNGHTYTGGLTVEVNFDFDFNTGLMTGNVDRLWGDIRNSTAPDGDEYLVIGTDGLEFEFSFATQIQASSSSPIIGIETWGGSQNLGSDLQWIQDPTGKLTVFKLTYGLNEFLLNLDFDLNKVSITNAAGNVELIINEDSMSDRIGSITVDGLKQADIYEDISEIKAIFNDGTVQLLAQDVFQ